MAHHQNNPTLLGSAITEALILALICEELKSRRFFSTLQELGLEDSHFQPSLDEVIMLCLGLDGANSTLDRYFRIMDTHAEKINYKPESVEEQAKLAYGKLTSFTQMIN